MTKTLRNALSGAAMFGAVAMFGANGANGALAGEQYVDETGFAISGYDVVAYHSLEQAPLGQPQTKAVPGNRGVTAEWNGAMWAFASEENRDLFLSDPEKYAPQFDGHCAYGVSQGGKVPANPHLWRIVDDRLYLNINDTVVGFWEADIPGLVLDADNKWTGLEADAASSNAVPAFDPAAAPQG